MNLCNVEEARELFDPNHTESAIRIAKLTALIKNTPIATTSSAERIAKLDVWIKSRNHDLGCRPKKHFAVGDRVRDTFGRIARVTRINSTNCELDYAQGRRGVCLVEHLESYR